MAQINELTALDELVASDNLPVYSSANGDARRSSLTVLQAYMQDNLTFSTVAPTTELVLDLTPQLGGDLDLNASNIQLVPAPTADLSASGIATTTTVIANATGFGAALYLNSSGGLEEADANAAATMPVFCLALSTGTGSLPVLLQGFIRNDAWSWTPGGLIYASGTTGGMTQTVPAASGDQIQVLGVATHAYRMYFNPSFVLAEVA